MKSAVFTLFVFVALMLIAAAPKVPEDQGPPPEMIRAAEEAAKKGIPFELIRLPSSSESATASGPSSTASGDGLQQSVTGTAPELRLSGGANAKGGNTKGTQSANAFDPFDPSGSNVSGWLFIVVGILLVVGRAWFPIIPLSAGWISIGVGVMLLIMPSYLNEHPWVGVVVLGIAALAAVLILGSKSRWFDLEIGPEKQQDLADKGQVDAAGALAHLQMRAPFTSGRKAAQATRVVERARARVKKIARVSDPNPPTPPPVTPAQ